MSLKETTNLFSPFNESTPQPLQVIFGNAINVLHILSLEDLIVALEVIFNATSE